MIPPMGFPVISVAQMREWEAAAWAAGRRVEDVIQLAGLRVAAHARALTASGETILVLAGKGNNGADGRAALPHLADRLVTCLDVVDPAANQTRLGECLARHPHLIIDALFGIGLDRPLSPEWIAIVNQVNAAGVPTLAVDVPSGLDANSGEPRGAAVAATTTLAIGTPKQGLLQEAAWPYVGRLEVASDVGLGEAPRADLVCTEPSDFHGFPPRRSVAAHKGTCGHLAIIAGSTGYHGAAVLAAKGAQRARPGLITLHTLEAVYHPIAAQLQSVMVAPWLPTTKLPTTSTAVLLGPGLAAAETPDQMKLLARNLWRDSALPLIVDASALDWLPLDPVVRNAIRVLTPHPGEAARLLRSSVAQVQADRLTAAREISRRFGGAWVVLKGHQTVIARASGAAFVNLSGNPYLAQGGSGDVLSGYLAGWLAQPGARADVAKLLCHGVWQHGAAADSLARHSSNWTVEELAAALGNQPAWPSRPVTNQ